METHTHSIAPLVAHQLCTAICVKEKTWFCAGISKAKQIARPHALFIPPLPRRLSVALDSRSHAATAAPSPVVVQLLQHACPNRTLPKQHL